MRNRVVVTMTFVVLLAGLVGSAHGTSYGYRFTNQCDANISVDFYTKTLLCKDYHSKPFGPGESWECSTKCPSSASVTLTFKDKRYPQTTNLDMQSTWGVYCTKQGDGSYTVTIQAE
jgi:hypothetical protein